MYLELKQPIRLISTTKISFESPPLSEVESYFESEAPKHEYIIALKIGSQSSKTLMCIEEEKCEFKYEVNYTPRIHQIDPIAYSGQIIQVNLLLYQSKDLKGDQNLFRSINIGDGGTCILGEDFTPSTYISTHSEHSYINCTLRATSTTAATLRFQTVAGNAYVVPE